MNKTWRIALAALALAVILGISLENSFARGHDDFRDTSLSFAQEKELRQMHRDMEDKHFELMELFAGKTVDAGQARALQKDIQDTKNKIGAFWLNAALAYKQTHPDWTPHFGGMGMGMRGMGGHGRGWGGPGGHGPAMMHDAYDD